MTVAQENGVKPTTDFHVRTAAQAYSAFVEHSGQLRVSTGTTILNFLRTIHQDEEIRCLNTEDCNLLEFASGGKAAATPTAARSLHHVEESYEAPYSRLSEELGKIITEVKFGQYSFAWNDTDFILYVASWEKGPYSIEAKQYIVVPTGVSTELVDTLILQAGMYCAQLSKQIYVFDDARWSKSREAWRSVQHSSWDDVVLDATMKKTLMDDILGFFNSRSEYKEFGVPWKRGIILHGMPGNGKTISIKAVMNSLGVRDDPIPSLLVKSFENSCGSPQYCIKSIFKHARKRAPCVLIFEDLDSLVTDKLRSYFLNEVDGIENNDGILMIGSTNHLDKLDPAISKRPSRFDRKYHYNLPALDQREAYCTYWKNKLAKNPKIDFPEPICAVVAKMTEGFSFAYLKELFVTSLLAIARGSPLEPENYEDKPPVSEDALNSPTVTKRDAELEKDMRATTDGGKTSGNKIVEPGEIPKGLQGNTFLNVLHRQVLVLRKDMDNSESSSAEEERMSAAMKAGAAAMSSVLAQPDVAACGC